MGMVGKNFFHRQYVGLALAAQSIAAAATVNGADITEPQRKGRQITFILTGGAIAANGSLQVLIKGKKRSDGTYVTLKKKDGTTDLEFTATLMDDATQLENGVIIGTLDMGDVDWETYGGLRLTAIENGGSGGGAVLLAASYVISDLFTEPSGMTDDIFAKAHQL